MSDSFHGYRETIQAEFPHVEPLIDINQSSQRAALCWIADVDSFEVTDDDILQRFVLALIYYRLVRVPYIVENHLQLNDRNWLTNVHECEWDFIECNSEKEMESLRLSGLSLVGKMPSEIALLTKLVALDLSMNTMTGEIASELWSMNQLLYLRLTGNRFSGTISKNVTNLHELKSLELGRNFWTGTIPSLETLTKLTSLSVIDNFQIGGTFPDISALTKLGKKASWRMPLYLLRLLLLLISHTIIWNDRSPPVFISYIVWQASRVSLERHQLE
jgi:hypothetical protein